MKIGIYRFKRCCKDKCSLLAFGRRPCGSLFVQMTLLTGMLGFLMIYATWHYSIVAQIPVILLSALYAALFIRLCLVEPGIVPEILA
mgnify:CR=1 FL=1